MQKPLIYEPMTAITDLLLALLALYCARELNAWYDTRLMNTHWHWTRGFVMLAIGAILGAISHGVGPYFSPVMKAAIWKMTTLSIGFVSFFFLLATFHHAFPFATVRWLRWLGVLFLVIYILVIMRDDGFANVVKFYAPTMAFILFIMLYSRWVGESPGAGWIAVGIVISFIAAGIQVSGFDLHRHFNHNDLYHVVQMVGLYLLYRGAMILTDYGVQP
jgi:hypothetical protein